LCKHIIDRKRLKYFLAHKELC